MTSIRPTAKASGERPRRPWRLVVATTALALGASVAGAPAASAAPARGLFDNGLLEPLDPVIEDVAVPNVVSPVGDLTVPVVELVPVGLVGRFPVQPVSIVGDELYEALGSLQPLHYEYEIENWGQFITERGRGRVGVPLPLSVSTDVTADILVDVTKVGTTPTVRVIRLPGAPHELDLSVRVTVAPHGWSNPERYEVHMHGGSTQTGFPDMAKVTVTELGPNPQFRVKTVNPGDHFTADVAQS